MEDIDQKCDHEPTTPTEPFVTPTPPTTMTATTPPVDRVQAVVIQTSKPSRPPSLTSTETPTNMTAIHKLDSKSSSTVSPPPVQATTTSIPPTNIPTNDTNVTTQHPFDLNPKTHSIASAPKVDSPTGASLQRDGSASTSKPASHERQSPGSAVISSGGRVSKHKNKTKTKNKNSNKTKTKDSVEYATTSFCQESSNSTCARTAPFFYAYNLGVISPNNILTQSLKECISRPHAPFALKQAPSESDIFPTTILENRSSKMRKITREANAVISQPFFDYQTTQTSQPQPQPQLTQSQPQQHQPSQSILQSIQSPPVKPPHTPAQPRQTTKPREDPDVQVL
eukprot:m.135912 g.135912  ORF g.135912 m.135912 type:complete len:339 (+) comp29827_c2_seq1:1711-2727(+)